MLGLKAVSHFVLQVEQSKLVYSREFSRRGEYEKQRDTLTQAPMPMSGVRVPYMPADLSAELLSAKACRTL